MVLSQERCREDWPLTSLRQLTECSYGLCLLQPASCGGIEARKGSPIIFLYLRGSRLPLQTFYQLQIAIQSKCGESNACANDTVRGEGSGRAVCVAQCVQGRAGRPFLTAGTLFSGYIAKREVSSFTISIANLAV